MCFQLQPFYWTNTSTSEGCFLTLTLVPGRLKFSSLNLFQFPLSSSGCAVIVCLQCSNHIYRILIVAAGSKGKLSPGEKKKNSTGAVKKAEILWRHQWVFIHQQDGVGQGGVGQVEWARVEWASDHPVRREHGFLLQDWACAQRVAGLNPVTGRVVMC